MNHNLHRTTAEGAACSDCNPYNADTPLYLLMLKDKLDPRKHADVIRADRLHWTRQRLKNS